jgi:hypothetical protein
MTRQIDLEAEIQRLLTEHDRVAEQGITVHRRENVVVLSGEVESTQRRDEICRQISGHFPEIEITCDIGITRAQAPSDVEEIS